MTVSSPDGFDPELIAAALPRYQLRREIGRGGWGVVFHAHHPTLGRSAAVKVLPPAFAADPATRDRFVAEAQTVANLDHPHVVGVFDFLEHDGIWLIVMEYMPGGTLWTRHTQSGVGSDEACAITVAIASALHAAHRREIVHRDIKPDNVLFTDGGVPKLGDFGIAKGIRAAPQPNEVGKAVGTPAYMSPEQATGDAVSERSDLYSLGVVLYELLTGRLPYPLVDDPSEQLQQHVHADPDPMPSRLPRGIVNVVMSALEKDPMHRPASAERFGLALAEAAENAYGSEWVATSGIQLLGSDAAVQAATATSARRPATSLPTYTDGVQTEGHERIGTMLEPDSTSSSTHAPSAAPTGEVDAVLDEATRSRGLDTVVPTSEPDPPDSTHVPSAAPTGEVDAVPDDVVRSRGLDTVVPDDDGPPPLASPPGGSPPTVPTPEPDLPPSLADLPSPSSEPAPSASDESPSLSDSALPESDLPTLADSALPEPDLPSPSSPVPTPPPGLPSPAVPPADLPGPSTSTDAGDVAAASADPAGSTRSSGPPKWVLAVAAVVVAVGAVVAIRAFTSSSDPDTSAYCEPASAFVDSDPLTAAPDEMGLLVTLGTGAAAEAPDDVVDAWIAYVGALDDVDDAAIAAAADSGLAADLVAAVARLEGADVQDAADQVTAHVAANCG
ncbi:MAG: protein kinase [Actinomycetota bacterium]